MAVYAAVTGSRSGLLRTRLAHFRRTLAGVHRGNPEALHRARVASRRLRELMPLLPSGRARKARRRLRKVTADLGVVREFDAMLQLIEERSTGQASPALDRLRAAVVVARGDARARLDERLKADDLHRLVRKLGRLMDDVAAAETTASAKPGARGWRWVLDARVAHRAGQLADAVRKTGTVYLPERLHHVRIAVKKLRYAVELAGEAGGQAMSAERRALKRSQDVLGRLHDLQRLVDRTRTVQASSTPAGLPARHAVDALVESFEDECRRLHAQYVRASGALTTMTEKLMARAKSADRSRPPVLVRPVLARAGRGR